MIAGPNPARAAQFSVIIPVYNDWESLEGCLQSLAEQSGGPDFEVIVVDDGSQDPAPESIRRWDRSYRLAVIPQGQAGVATARNRGIQASKGEVLVFTDADCRFQPNCLSALAAAIASSPRHNCFQLHIGGDFSNLVGRAEGLRLIALQERTQQPDGGIRYLNTSGFAIRRSRVNVDSALFDPAALRAEDTLLLANLIRQGEMPRFVGNARVQHSISLSFWGCLLKDFQMARLERRTSQLIKRTGVQVRMQNRDRMRMLVSTWKLARHPSIGVRAWAVLVARQLVARTVMMLDEYFPFAV